MQWPYIQQGECRTMTERVNSHILYTRITFYLVYTSAKQSDSFLRSEAAWQHIFYTALRVASGMITLTSALRLTSLLSTICGKKEAAQRRLVFKVKARQSNRRTRRPSLPVFYMWPTGWWHRASIQRLRLSMYGLRHQLRCGQVCQHVKCAASGQTGREVRGKYWSTSRSCLQAS